MYNTIKIYFLVAVIVSGATEWLKNFLPDKVKDNNKIMAGIAAVLSVAGSIVYLFMNKSLNNTIVTWQTIVTFSGVVVGLTQSYYNVLVQTFKALKTKLTQKVTVDLESTVDSITDKIAIN
jgi:hypothetical protein